MAGGAPGAGRAGMAGAGRLGMTGLGGGGATCPGRDLRREAVGGVLEKGEDISEVLCISWNDRASSHHGEGRFPLHHSVDSGSTYITYIVAVINQNKFRELVTCSTSW